jgi:phosphoribosylamine--glycine ligase
VNGSIVFQSGTAMNDGKLVTAGGRVLAVTSLGNNMDEARNACYQNMAHINYKGKRHRSDIGADLSYIEKSSAHV